MWESPPLVEFPAFDVRGESRHAPSCEPRKAGTENYIIVRLDEIELPTAADPASSRRDLTLVNL
jgi:hypothetical protein